MNDRIKQLLATAEKFDGLADIKRRIANRDQLRKERKEKLKELMEKDKQQTAVEWFIEELEEKGKAYEENQVVRTINICIDVSDYMELKQQANERHKQQIINAVDDQNNYDSWPSSIPTLGEQYYNETYK